MGSSELGLASLPPIFVLQTNFPEAERHEAEDTVYEAGGKLSYKAKEAKIFLGRLSQKKRAAFELRTRGVWTEECALPEGPARKRRKVGSPLKTSSASSKAEYDIKNMAISEDEATLKVLAGLDDHVVVLKFDWLQKSLEAGHLLPHQSFLVYSGRIVEKPKESATRPQTPPKQITFIDATPNVPSSASGPANEERKQQESTLDSILDQTKFNGSNSQQLPIMKYSPRRFRDHKHSGHTTIATSHPSLKRTTTSEHDFLTGSKGSSSLPELPAWMLESHPRANYACMRSTYMETANDAFLKHLYKIKDARLLTLDEIGVRAYSTSIASLAAYPYVISSPIEITRLPGCSEKIAALWVEWFTSADPEAPDTERHLAVTDQLDKDEDLKHLNLFWNIWGVGADTARKFYFENGWKDLDDVVEYGWNSGQLSRVQQIGVKFYDEFLVKIPRKEVEEISDVILHHARLCRTIPKQWWSNKKNGYRGNWAKPDDGRGDPNWDPRDMVCVIVGGYRRGKAECGDVDVILSHRDEEYTKDLVVDVVKSLEDAGYITHTLTLNTTTTDRDQQTLPYRERSHAGAGFDSLDKALCVWQDPEYDTEKHEKNPNIHRRVDIIISPWRTVGTGVLGWSGSTTFERDIRRWCRKEHGWKFDSSGVRDRATGEVLEFESPKVKKNGKQKEGEVMDEGDGWEDRERRLMEGLGIGWRPATQRCTG